MPYLERVGNLHIHTTASDGSASHARVAELAAEAGLDFCIVTDHNAYEPLHEGWYGPTLMLVGQEIHDPERPHVNHLLVLNAGVDLTHLAQDTQALVDAVRQRGGLSFIAHPFEHSGALSGEPEINWTAWEVQGATGIELWNYMSEFKSYVTDTLRTLCSVLAPGLAISGPYAETVLKWDALLQHGRIYAIAGSDAHATVYQLGPLRRAVFGYAHLFRALNTHILVSEPWTGAFEHDSRLVYEALSQGRAFVAYDGLAPARGFSFGAVQRDHLYVMGESAPATRVIRFEVHTPARARIRLMLNGFCIAETRGRELSYESKTPGAYRVEATRWHAFKQRGWIYSNPIFVASESPGARRPGLGERHSES
ncbi:MAG: CehA/McbA family metallohydrolase [Anaerolineae bacterium]|nr:CehA/McbA family metallohydrolase [Anaerolineae bacterium]